MMDNFKINTCIKKDHVAVSISNNASSSIEVKPLDKQLLYVRDEKIGITGGNEIVPPEPSIDGDLLALYLLGKGAN